MVIWEVRSRTHPGSGEHICPVSIPPWLPGKVLLAFENDCWLQFSSIEQRLSRLKEILFLLMTFFDAWSFVSYRVISPSLKDNVTIKSILFHFLVHESQWKSVWGVSKGLWIHSQEQTNSFIVSCYSYFEWFFPCVQWISSTSFGDTWENSLILSLCLKVCLLRWRWFCRLLSELSLMEVAAYHSLTFCCNWRRPGAHCWR